LFAQGLDVLVDRVADLADALPAREQRLLAGRQAGGAPLTEICCPTMERASVTKASPRDSSMTSPNWGMIFFITRSLRARCAQASAQ